MREWGLDDPHGYVELLDGPLDTPAVWHMHGTILRPHDVVLALDGYKKLYIPGANERWEKALTTLRTLLTTRTFLFVGFSFADQYFTDQVEYIAELFEGAGRTHYVLLRNDAEFPATQDRLKPLPIRCIPYQDYGAPLIRVLEDLASYRSDAGSGGTSPASGGGGIGSGTLSSANGVAPGTVAASTAAANTPAADAMGFAPISSALRAQSDALILFGKWAPACDGDREAPAQLGVDSTDLERACADLAGAEPPLVRFEIERGGQGHWTWTRPKDTWRRLLPGIPPSLIDRFAALATAVLTERDPSLDMPPNERYLAPVQGKLWRFSAALREGIATNLVRLSESDELLRPMYGTSRGSLLAHAVVREVLSAEWQAWASLDALLPYLAEAAPPTFLDRVDASLTAGSAGVVQLFAQESRFGHSWHTGLLWGLETLGWRPELMSRVAVVFARLAKHDPGGNLANRPLRCLQNLLHPIVPQSRSSGDERMRLLRTVAEREPDIAWRAGLKMFASTLPPGEVMFSSRRPQIAEWDVPRDTEEIAADSAKQVSDLLTFLIASCRTDPTRWPAMLALVLRMSHEDARRVLGEFADTNGDASGDASAVLRATVREVLHDAYQFREAWQVSDDVVLRLKEQYRRLTPDDPVARVAWLFGARVVLPEVTGDWEQERLKVAERQAEAITELWKRDDRWPQLTQLAATVESPNQLGHLLGEASYAAEVETVLLESTDPSLTRLLPSFAARRYHQLKIAWLDDALRMLMRAGRQDDVLAVLTNIRPEPAIWDLIEQCVPESWLDYWKAVGTIYGPFSPTEWTRAIQALLQAGRPAQALVIASHAKNDLEPATALGVLHALATALPDELHLLAAGGTGAYHLERVFSALDRSTEAIPLEELVSLELAFLGFLERSPETTRHLFNALEQVPELFAQLVTTLYRSDEEPDAAASSAPPDTSSPADMERRQRAATNADRIMYAWRGYPGRDRPPDVADKIALDWCEAVLALTRDAHRQDMGAYEVGRVLARMPAAADGVWPTHAARELLKRPDAAKIARGLYIGKRNARGVFSRKLGDGGEQERALAATFRRYADTLRADWPEVAGVLDQLATAYAHEAEEQDEIDKADQRRYATGDEQER